MSPSSGKTLKLSFAMGGGVSLGAFSGAALTEALKLLVVDGRDDQGQLYSKIELDCMSGASAGAISLCIMLSSLLNYKRYLSTDSPTPDNRFHPDVVDRELADQFGHDWKTKYSDRVEDLRALQVAQKLQEKLWVDKVNMQDLMRIDEFNPDKKESFSLLNRSLLIELVQDYILADLDQITAEQPRIVAEDRFLFACSLTNLTPLPLGNLEQENVQPLVRELRKAYASFNHKELRVFDFQLNEDKKPPSKLLKALVINRGDDEEGFPIYNPETWSMIAATCLACGAFPFAFEPVALRRFAYEYYEQPQSADDIHIDTIIPGDTIETIESNIPVFQSEYSRKYGDKVRQIASTYTAEEKQSEESEIGKEEFIFSYIDGGTLNNEPIREAFRMANYLDARDPADRSTYDRIVIFVDPIVRTEPVNRNSSDFDRYTVREIKNKLVVRKNPEFNRLSSYTQKIIRTLRDQGSIKEEHKISTYVSSINLHRQLSDLIRKSNFDGEFSNDFVVTVTEFITYQERNNNDEQISTFDVNDHTFIKNSIVRYVKDHKLDINANILVKNFYQILIIIDRVRNHQYNTETAKVEMNMVVGHGQKQWIKKIFYQFILQAILDADGKDPSAMRMSITPVRYNVDEGDNIKSIKTISLPGGEFEAFGGFVSRPARMFSNIYGKFCAYKTLASKDFRKHFNSVMTKDIRPLSQESLIAENPDLSETYKTQLRESSPLNSSKKASSYWQHIKSNIYELFRKRIRKSLTQKVFSRKNLVLFILILFIVMGPWYLHQFLPIPGFALQLLILVILGYLVYAFVNHQAIKKLKHSFQYHEIDSLKLAIKKSDLLPKFSFYKFNDFGRCKRLYQTDNVYILPIPFHIKRDPNKGEYDPDGMTFQFLTHQRIAKRFDKSFSLLEEDLSSINQIQSITFYRRQLYFFRRRVDFVIRQSQLHQIEGLKQLEQHISPRVHVDMEVSGQIKFRLVELARPLEDTIVTTFKDRPSL